MAQWYFVLIEGTDIVGYVTVQRTWKKYMRTEVKKNYTVQARGIEIMVNKKVLHK